MNTTAQNISHLLDKYWEGMTSPEEEKELQAYFNSGNVAEHLKSFQPYFGFFQQEKEVQLSAAATEQLVAQLQEKSTSDKGRILSLLPHLWKFAAAVILLIGLAVMVPQWAGYGHQNAIAQKEDSYEDPEKAYEEVKAALMLVSNKMKKGTSVADKNLGKLKKASIFRSEETEL